MTRDLSSLLNEFAEAEGRASMATAPTVAAEAAALGSRITRRRMLRSGGTVVASAAALVVMAVGVQSLTAPEPTAPADPTPSVSPEPSPSPTSSRSPSPTPTAEPGATPAPEPEALGVTVHPLLPSALPIEPGMLEAAGEGWSLVEYRDLEPGQGEEEYLFVGALYLVSPVGERYEVPTADLGTVEIVDWLPGTSRVLVESYGSDSSTWQIRDLTTGETLAELGSPTGPAALVDGGDAVIAYRFAQSEASPLGSVVRMSAAGTVEAQVASSGLDGAFGAVNPARTYVLDADPDTIPRVMKTSDLSPVTLPPMIGDMPLDNCEARQWFGDDVLLRCHSQSGPDVNGVALGAASLWRVPLDGSAPTMLAVTTQYTPNAPSVIALQELWDVDGRIVGRAFDGRVAEITADGAIAPLPLTVLNTAEAAGGRLLAFIWPTGSAEARRGFYSLDPFTGQGTELVPVGETGYATALTVGG